MHAAPHPHKSFRFPVERKSMGQAGEGLRASLDIGRVEWQSTRQSTRILAGMMVPDALDATGNQEFEVSANEQTPPSRITCSGRSPNPRPSDYPSLKTQESPQIRNLPTGNPMKPFSQPSASLQFHKHCKRPCKTSQYFFRPTLLAPLPWSLKPLCRLGSRIPLFVIRRKSRLSVHWPDFTPR